MNRDTPIWILKLKSKQIKASNTSPFAPSKKEKKYNQSEVIPVLILDLSLSLYLTLAVQLCESLLIIAHSKSSSDVSST